MTEWIRDWGILVATVALLCVTAWYAYLTKRLSDAATKSAESARIAAEASRASVAATVASVNVDFIVLPYYYSVIPPAGAGPTRGGAFGVQVRCAGATVFVHSVRLEAVGESFPLGSGRQGLGITFDRSLAGVDLRVDNSVALPRRLHKGETFSFKLPAMFEGQGPEEAAAIRATVEYSLTGEGQTAGRHVEWFDFPEGEVERGSEPG